MVLKTIRKKIISSPINKQLLKDVEEQIMLNIPTERARFRSSTNAEDIEGFGGAGLYSSKTGILKDTIKSIENAIKEVWASLWNDKAFLERLLFKIDQENMAMGILVHESFPNEKANGVAVTRNLFSENDKGYTINAQIGEISVVSPSKNTLCDQILAKRTNEGTFGYQYYSKSNKSNSQPVLSVNQLDIISASPKTSKIGKYS